jgi:hypothetical protein
MGNFIVENPNRPKPGDANYESLRSDKTKMPPATRRDYEIVAFNIAINMIKQFGFRPWMSMPDVVSSNGERINLDSEIYTPRFRKK